MIENSIAFTGHRAHSLPFGDDSSSPAFQALKDDIRMLLVNAIEQAADTFYCGMADGADILCGEIVAELRERDAHIRLVCVLPYRNHGRRMEPLWRERHRALLEAANEIVYVSEHSDRGCYHRRNRYMVDHAATLLAIYDGRETGGTAQTIRYARKLGRTVYVLNPRAY